MADTVTYRSNGLHIHVYAAYSTKLEYFLKYDLFFSVPTCKC